LFFSFSLGRSSGDQFLICFIFLFHFPQSSNIYQPSPKGDDDFVIFALQF
jgi:hypothetical protein